MSGAVGPGCGEERGLVAREYGNVGKWGGHGFWKEGVMDGDVDGGVTL